MKRITLLMGLAVLASIILQKIPAQAFPVGGYTRIYEGIEYASGTATSPRLMRAFALRISLKNPDVRLYASHSNGGSPYDVTLQTTNAFLSEHGLQAAVNANFWDVATSPDVDVLGLAMCDGGIVSNAQLDYGWYAFTSDKTPQISNPTSTNPSGKHTAIGGSYVILSNGAIVTGDGTINPYTGFGCSSDSKYLIMVCVDGRQPGWSDGCSVIELAQWLKDFGAYNGIRMDGGGSTTMVRADMGTVNRPCYGYSRSVATSLGVYATGDSKKGPDVDAMNPNRVDIVIRGNLNDIWLKTGIENGGWTYQNLGGSTLDNPAINSRYDGHLNVFYRGSNDALYRNTSDDGGATWVGWSGSLGGDILSGPAACSMNQDRIDIIARGASNHVKHITWTTAGGWGSWADIGGNSGGGTPAICSRQDGALSAFSRGSDNKLYRTNWTAAGGWAGWSSSLGGTLESGPSACSRDADHVTVCARGSGSSLVEISYNSATGWGGWVTLDDDCISKPGICAPDANTMKIYWRSSNDHLKRIIWTSTGGWGGIADLGAYFD